VVTALPSKKTPPQFLMPLNPPPLLIKQEFLPKTELLSKSNETTSKQYTAAAAAAEAEAPSSEIDSKQQTSSSEKEAKLRSSDTQSSNLITENISQVNILFFLFVFASFYKLMILFSSF
jgi:hypothetical protein